MGGRREKERERDGERGKKEMWEGEREREGGKERKIDR